MPQNIDAQKQNILKRDVQTPSRFFERIGKSARLKTAALLLALAPSPGIVPAGAAEKNNQGHTTSAPADHPVAEHAQTKEGGHGGHGASLVLDAWKKKEPLETKIYSKQTIQQYFDALTPAEQASAFFRDEVPCADGCMDERVSEIMDGGQELHEIRSAGSDILDLDGDLLPMDPTYILAVAKKHNHLKIQRETYHTGCGAARLALGLQRNLSGAALDAVSNKEIVNFAKEWTEKVIEKRREILMAEGMQEEADALGIIFISAEKLQGPEDVHIADRIALDFTGKYDGSNEVLPPMFVMSGNTMSESSLVRHALLATAIALGKHGAGELITPKHPLSITIIVDPTAMDGDADHIIDLISHKLTEEQRARIRFESFTPHLDRVQDDEAKAVQEAEQCFPQVAERNKRRNDRGRYPLLRNLLRNRWAARR
ncbi:MAG: hypothetical protein WCG83_03565 [Candidatus Peregrinibacteria bacterium]